MTTAHLDSRRKRLIYRSEHTGTHETDLLLGQFARAHVPEFDETELDQYEHLLEASDPDLWLWLTGRLAPPPEFATPVLARLRAHRYDREELAPVPPVAAKSSAGRTPRPSSETSEGRGGAPARTVDGGTRDTGMPGPEVSPLAGEAVRTEPGAQRPGPGRRGLR